MLMKHKLLKSSCKQFKGLGREEKALTCYNYMLKSLPQWSDWKISVFVKKKKKVWRAKCFILHSSGSCSNFLLEERSVILELKFRSFMSPCRSVFLNYCTHLILDVSVFRSSPYSFMAEMLAGLCNLEFSWKVVINSWYLLWPSHTFKSTSLVFEVWYMMLACAVCVSACMLGQVHYSVTAATRHMQLAAAGCNCLTTGHHTAWSTPKHWGILREGKEYIHWS